MLQGIDTKFGPMVHISGMDETVYSIILFLLDLTTKPGKDRKRVGEAISYFRDRGMPIIYSLHDEVMGCWGRLTRSFGSIFSTDGIAPISTDPPMVAARRKAIWNRISSALEIDERLPIPGWADPCVPGVASVYDDLPTESEMLRLMADLMGEETLERLSRKCGAGAGDGDQPIASVEPKPPRLLHLVVPSNMS